MLCKAYGEGELLVYKYVVTFARYEGKWILCKHKKRETWEVSGGHIEAGETPIEAAKRELYEETGAIEFDIEPLCDYWAADEQGEALVPGEANGRVFVAKVKAIGELPESEMERIGLFEVFPGSEQLTYPDIMRVLFPLADAVQ